MFLWAVSDSTTQLYLSEASAKASIISSKISEVNVTVPTGEGEGSVNIECVALSQSVQLELPVPEQFKTVWDGFKFVTSATGHV